MEPLLPHYECEVGLLLRSLTEFTQRYPKIGARLGIGNGHGDLHVDRMIQTFALLAARVDAKLEDSCRWRSKSALFRRRHVTAA
ncbi:hypothetical protein WS62_10050 [Burkholderia sp. ABCPW 14]|uniref:type VI secretion system baseplate subunit TssF n=1 Tax=Burkholderia sp. ABCPW 14 TaxID=1637860 RepID=UPI000770CC72|nr:type VI secretion system baseplate subunit TssF [Burkholderia sp. ABCPW 14]KVD71668.1 hypothetical protein WS62_10050 [Burkholderia sp. ABCPW 14]